MKLIIESASSDTYFSNFFRLADKTKNIDTSFVMGVQNILGGIISFIIIKFSNMGSITKNCSMGDVAISAMTYGSMYCSNQALKFVNYPFMALAKSAKILSIIMTGWTMGT